MGRFSAVSVVSDKQTKVIDAGLKLTSSGTGVAARVERVESVTGSSAGASSSQFHNFLNARKRETERWNRIEQSAKDEEEQKAFADKVEQNRLEAEERTKKNAAKRNKKKEKRKAKIASTKNAKNNDNDDNDDNDDNNNDNKDDDDDVANKKQRTSNEA